MLIIKYLPGGLFIEDGIAGFYLPEFAVSLEEMRQGENVLLVAQTAQPEDDKPLYIKIRVVTVMVDTIAQD